MPRVTISIIAPNHAHDHDLLTLDLPQGLLIADLKGFLHAETQLPPDQQQFYLNNVPIQGDDKTLEEAGIKDGDLLAMMVRQQQQPQSSNSSGSNNNSSSNNDATMDSRRLQQRRQNRPGETDIEATRQSILRDPAAMASVRERGPALAEAIHDPDRFRQVWTEMIREEGERRREQEEQMRLLNEDPFNIEAQREILERIRQESVQENIQHAIEHNPEFFGRVTMLYVPVEVNKQPVKAFVDSGAQTTIMSPSCAEACGIMRLIDKRYSGVARGVGTAQILGRVHSADIKIGNSFMSCSFTVMEGKDVDLLLGLDMLKRFQALIDLKRNKLVFGDGNEVEFLGEAEIPKQLEDAQLNEPTVSGPNGTEIGAQTGTVRPAGSSAAAAAASSSSSSSAANGGSFHGQGQRLGGSSTPKPTPAASVGAQASPAHPKEKIDQLQSLGFSRDQAIAALDACNGNVEYAAGLLFQS